MTDNLKPSADYAAGWSAAIEAAANQIQHIVNEAQRENTQRLGSIDLMVLRMMGSIVSATRALTPPGAHAAALDKLLAEAKADGMREAAAMVGYKAHIIRAAVTTPTKGETK